MSLFWTRLNLLWKRQTFERFTFSFNSNSALSSSAASVTCRRYRLLTSSCTSTASSWKYLTSTKIPFSSFLHLLLGIQYPHAGKSFSSVGHVSLQQPSKRLARAVNNSFSIFSRFLVQQKKKTRWYKGEWLVLNTSSETQGLIVGAKWSKQSGPTISPWVSEDVLNRDWTSHYCHLSHYLTHYSLHI